MRGGFCNLVTIRTSGCDDLGTVGGGGSKISERGGRRRLLQPYPTEGDGMEVWYGMVGWLKYLHKSDSLSS